MRTITLHNVPDEIYAELNERASRQGKTVEDEVLECIGAHLGGPHDVDRTLAELDQFRASLGNIYVTEADLQRAKREGRP